MSNPLNKISQVYLDQVANIKKMENEDDVDRWTQTEAVKGEDSQRRKDAAIERRSSKRLSPSAGKTYATGTKASIDWWAKKTQKESVGAKSLVMTGQYMKPAIQQEKQKKKLKESLSNWRTDLAEVIDKPITDVEAEKEVKEKTGIKNKVVINPQLTETVEGMGGELLEVIEYDPIEDAVEYFFEEGINEEGIELIIEEIGLQEFVEFVENSAVDLNEERDARKASVRAKKYDVVKKEVDAADAARRKSKKGEYAPSYAKKETDVTVYDDDKPAAKKKAPAKKTVAKKAAPKPAAKKPAPKLTAKKPTPAKKAQTKKKVVTSVARVKKVQPAKPVSKKGIRGVIQRGVERHQKAVAKVKGEVKKITKTASDTAKQHAGHRKKLISGLRATPKERKIAGGIAKAAKKALVGEEVGVSTSAAMEKARKEAELKAKEEAAVAKKKKVKEEFSNWRDDLQEKDLNAAERRALPDKDFVFPGKGEGPKGKQRGAYPIPDEKHARNALAMAAAHASPAKQAKVRAAVKKKFPGIQVSESRDKALDIVRANIIKKHGEGAIYDPKRDKPTEADKKKAAAERQKRQAEKNKAFAARAKKAGYNNPQDYANVVARYGSEDNMKKGKGLGS
jgi:hypothetical protein